jgi:hypothetical protein
MTEETVRAAELLTSLTPSPHQIPGMDDVTYAREAGAAVVLTSSVIHLVAKDHPTAGEAMNMMRLVEMCRLIASGLYRRGMIPHFPEMSSVELLIGTPES